MSKNIVVFSDGTGQMGGRGFNTNVYKLFNMVEDRTNRQVAFYDPGLGTDWRKITGNLSGRGFSKNLLDCYHFIFQNYQAGDEIFLFGFSRGAATVRSLSGFIHLFGVLPKCREDLIREAFRIYKIKDEKKREEKARLLVKKNSTMWVKIKFLGVFDTVAALGMPFQWLSVLIDRVLPHRFHNFKLSKSVEYARHALSIDDERKTFHPAIWEKLEQPSDRLKQVWFSGVHTDVGGGYEDEKLSNIPLCWMVKEATAKGLLLYEKSEHYETFKQCVSDVNGEMHNEQKGFIGKIFRRAQRTWDVEKYGVPCIHESVLKRTRNNQNADAPPYKPWLVTQFNEYVIEPWTKDNDVNDDTLTSKAGTDTAITA